MKSELRFGTGGLPLTNTGDIFSGIALLHQLGLKHLELEFVQSVYITEAKAPLVKETAAANDISLSVHGSYYINLASPEADKWHAGIGRIVKAADIGAQCGAQSVTYHTGFFQGKPYPAVKERVVAGMTDVCTQLKAKNAEIKIAPELTGKASQVGSLEELIDLVKTMRDLGFGDYVSLCIDFAHSYARSGGGVNTYAEQMHILDAIAKGLGAEYLQKLHIHLSAIEFGPKGEKNHLTCLDSLDEYKDAGIEVPGIEKAWSELKVNRQATNHFNWQDVLRALKQAEVGGFVVCESPILELDALLMQQFYHSV